MTQVLLKYFFLNPPLFILFTEQNISQHNNQHSHMHTYRDVFALQSTPVLTYFPQVFKCEIINKSKSIPIPQSVGV